MSKTKKYTFIKVKFRTLSTLLSTFQNSTKAWKDLTIFELTTPPSTAFNKNWSMECFLLDWLL